jgi:hypothetical protein
MRDVCWICHSWQERYFSIEISEEMRSLNEGKGDCFIHFRHENYKAVKMYLSDDGKRFEMGRMCPIDSIQFFFSFSANNQRRIFTSKDYQQLYQEQQVSFMVGPAKVTEVVQCRNNDQSDYYTDVIDEAYVPNIELLPRTPDVSVNEG